MNEMTDKYEQKNPFSVPEGYFDSLEDRIMIRVRKEERSRRARLLRVFKPFMGWAALVAVVVLVMVTVLPARNEGIAETQLDADFNPTTEEILEYLAGEVDLAVLSNEILGR